MRAPGIMLIAFTLFLNSCGGVPSSVPHVPDLHVWWRVNADRTEATCWERADPMPIEVYSAGYFCWSSCALVGDEPRAVMLDVHAEKDGKHFVPAEKMPLYTGPCGSDVKCPTCDY